MQHPLELQIREHISHYVTGQNTLDQFLDQFMNTAEEAEEVGDSVLLDFVDTVKLYWSEYTNGDRSEEDFRTATVLLFTEYLNQPNSDAR